MSVTSEKYAVAFGFTEEEVFASMDSQGIDPSQKALVKKWYDGYVMGNERDIYNPWSITYYLDIKKSAPIGEKRARTPWLGSFCGRQSRRSRRNLRIFLRAKA
ncbi:MAG: AAA family ATPase [Lachnospiraceae bacterium]|nr:AAA family ATPase [Lachnospiraceae bacterium]